MLACALPHIHKPLLCSMLAVTSAHLNYVFGRGLFPDTLQWTVANVHCVNRLISIPETRYGDEALMGILSVLNVDILAGSGMNIEIHSRCLAKLLLRHHGGLQSLRDSQSTDLFVSFLLVTPAGKAQSAYLDHVTPGEEMDHNLLILTLKSLVQWVVSTRWSTESPELYDRAVIVIFSSP